MTVKTKLTHHIYVVELDARIWKDRKKFRDANPRYRHKKECLYVGITSTSPEERLHKHLTGGTNKKGVKISSNIVEKYGKILRPSLYAPLNPMTRERAVLLEKSLSESLRKRGYAVWWN